MIIHLYLTLKGNFNKYIFQECDDFSRLINCDPVKLKCVGASLFMRNYTERRVLNQIYFQTMTIDSDEDEMVAMTMLCQPANGLFFRALLSFIFLCHYLSSLIRMC